MNISDSLVKRESKNFFIELCVSCALVLATKPSFDGACKSVRGTRPPGSEFRWFCGEDEPHGRR
jgi:hypothetical protein